MAANKRVNFFMPGEMEVQNQAIDRKRKLAEALQQSSMEPLQGQLISGHYVAPSITQYLAQGLKGWQANKQLDEADRTQEEMVAERQRKQQELADMIRNGGNLGDYIAQGGDNQALINYTQGEQNYTRGREDKIEDRVYQEGREDTVYARNRGDHVQDMNTQREWSVDDRTSNQNFQIGQQNDSQDFQRGQQDNGFAQQWKMHQSGQNFQANQGALSRAQQERLATIKNNPDAKPLPTAALKMQQESIEKMQTARNINTDLGGFVGLIDSGKLDFGLASNAISRARNWAGRSDEQSKNFGTFTSSLEKLRNDSLRLNSGVQTEGDAQRAWNELFANINDKGLVKQRLLEIQEINKRAEMLQQMNIDNVRANYGHEPLMVAPVADKPITSRGASCSYGAAPAGAVRVKGQR